MITWALGLTLMVGTVVSSSPWAQPASGETLQQAREQARKEQAEAQEAKRKAEAAVASAQRALDAAIREGKSEIANRARELIEQNKKKLADAEARLKEAQTWLEMVEGLIASESKAAPYSLPDEHEILLGRKRAQELERGIAFVDDRQVNTYMQGLVRQLAVHSTRSHLPYTIKVVRCSKINAYSLPGGYLYVNSGLVEAASNESELAAMLAHEVAHVAARHSSREIANIARSVALGIEVGALTGPLTGFGLLTQRMVQESAYFKFSREQEREADRLAVEILYRAGIKPTGLVTLFEKLRRGPSRKPTTNERCLPIPSDPSSHPSPAERMQNIAPLLADPRFHQTHRVDSPEFHSVRSRLVSP
jgi:hypothetical protein